MPATISLSVDKRTVVGRKVNRLRRDQWLPANIYGKSVASQAIQVKALDFTKIFKTAGETNIINLLVSGEKTTLPVLVHNVQTHPVTDQYLHIDFHQVSLEEKVTATIPVEVVGESTAVKEKGGVLVLVVDEIEVETLPLDLPDKLTVDVGGLANIGDSLLVKDLKVDRDKVKLLIDDTATIVVVQEPKTEVEPTPPPAEAEAAATVGETPPATTEVKTETKPESETVKGSEPKPEKK